MKWTEWVTNMVVYNKNMNEQELENFLNVFAHAVIKSVSTRTHTDWSKYLDPVVKKYIKYYYEKLHYNNCQRGRDPSH